MSISDDLHWSKMPHIKVNTYNNHMFISISHSTLVFYMQTLQRNAAFYQGQCELSNLMYPECGVNTLSFSITGTGNV